MNDLHVLNGDIRRIQTLLKLLPEIGEMVAWWKKKKETDSKRNQSTKSHKNTDENQHVTSVKTEPAITSGSIKSRRQDSSPHHFKELHTVQRTFPRPVSGHRRSEDQDDNLSTSSAKRSNSSSDKKQKRKKVPLFEELVSDPESEISVHLSKKNVKLHNKLSTEEVHADARSSRSVSTCSQSTVQYIDSSDCEIPGVSERTEKSTKRKKSSHHSQHGQKKKRSSVDSRKTGSSSPRESEQERQKKKKKKKEKTEASSNHHQEISPHERHGKSTKHAKKSHQSKDYDSSKSSHCSKLSAPSSSTK